MCNHGIKIAWLLILPPSPKRGGGQRAGARENRGAGEGGKRDLHESLLILGCLYKLIHIHSFGVRREATACCSGAEFLEASLPREFSTI